MHRPVTTILTAMALALPLGATAGDNAQRPDMDSPPTAQELRDKVRQWQRSFQTLRESSAKGAGIKLVPAGRPAGKSSGDSSFDLPDGCYYFSAESVAACQRMTPTVDQLRRQGFRIIKVDIAINAELADRYAIKTIPTLLIKRGAEVVKLNGVQDEAALRATLLKHHLQHEVARLPKGKDADPMVLIAYPVGKLVLPTASGDGAPPKPDFDPLVHLIVAVVEPEYWEESGGKGKLVPIDKTLTLVVQQTPRVHAQIRIVLDELRKLKDESRVIRVEQTDKEREAGALP
jgi:thiol-disulfide isomerase/thioredoxin